jgi:Polyketide cyclase / dehydrase and lipid transport
MPRRYEFEASARSRASAEAIWPLVGQATRWKEWAWLTRTDLVREGDPPPDGVGALRRFAFGPGASNEEVVAWDPPRHLGYVVVRGLPVRSYRADVHLDDVDAGTEVTWRCSVEPLVPGTGAVLRFALGRMVRGFARSLCRYADREMLEGS